MEFMISIIKCDVLVYQEIVSLVLERGSHYSELQYVNLLQLLARSRPGTDQQTFIDAKDKLRDFLIGKSIMHCCLCIICLRLPIACFTMHRECCES